MCTAFCTGIGRNWLLIDTLCMPPARSGYPDSSSPFEGQVEIIKHINRNHGSFNSKVFFLDCALNLPGNCPVPFDDSFPKRAVLWVKHRQKLRSQTQCPAAGGQLCHRGCHKPPGDTCGHPLSSSGRGELRLTVPALCTPSPALYPEDTAGEHMGKPVRVQDLWPQHLLSPVPAAGTSAAATSETKGNTYS